MLTRLEVTNAVGETLILPLTNEGSGYIVQDVDGLAPVKAAIVSSTFANLDGGQYQSSRREIRNITIRLGLEPDYYNQTVQSLRQSLYSFFIPKSYVRIRFHIGTGLDYDISGYVETMETALFSKDPVANISVLCMNPDFTDSDTLTVHGETTSGLTETTFTYAGTSPTGFLFTLLPDRNVTDFDIYMRSPNGVLQALNFTTSLLADDELRINTVSGEKSVVLTRAAVETPMLYALSSSSVWIQLSQGIGYLRVYAAGAPVPFVITYRNAYGGL